MSSARERSKSRNANFKKGICSDDARRGRNESAYEIRKSKREDKLAKRRQKPTTSSNEVRQQSNPSSNNVWVQKLNNNQSPPLVLEACTHFRKQLSLEKDPPIQEIINLGIVPRLMQLCTFQGHPNIQYEAAWALTNVASGTKEQTKVVIDNHGIEVFVQLLSAQDVKVSEQAIWALGNISGDSTDARDLVLSKGAMVPLIQLINRSTKMSVLRNGTWCVSNFCRGKPAPEFEMVAPALQIIPKLLDYTDEEILTDACWAVSYLSDGDNKRIDAVVKSGILPKLVRFLNHKNISIQTPALRAIGNVVTGTDAQTQAALNCGVVKALAKCLSCSRKGIRKEAVWTLSNVAAGTAGQIEQLIRANVFPKIIKMAGQAEWEIRKEACWTLSNACSGGTRTHISLMASHGMVRPLCDLLVHNDSKMVMVALEALGHVLKAGKKDAEKMDRHGYNSYADMIEDEDGLDKLENLQSHESVKIYEKAVDLLEKYFCEEDDEELEGFEQNIEGDTFAFGDDGFGSENQSMNNASFGQQNNMKMIAAGNNSSFGQQNNSFQMNNSMNSSMNMNNNSFGNMGNSVFSF